MRKLLVIFLLISSIGYSQTTDSILVAKDRHGFTRYSVSPNKMAEFYVYQKNLAEVSIALQQLKSQYDTINTRSALIDSNYKVQVDSLQQIALIYKRGLDDCQSTANKINDDNTKLFDKNKKLKKNQIRLVGLGAILVLVGEIVIKVLIVK